MFKRISVTVMAIFVIFIAGFLILLSDIKNNESKAVQADNIYGWAWSENFGWISFNCYNYYNETLTDKCSTGGGVDFGVNVDEATGNLTGYGWSENHGWVDFAPAGPYPEAPNYSAKLGTDGMITGWAHVLALGGGGWIKFQGRQCNDPLSHCDLYGSPPYTPDYRLTWTPETGQSSLCYNCNKYKFTCTGTNDPGRHCLVDLDCATGDLCDGDMVVDNDGQIKCTLCFPGHLPDPSMINAQKYGTGGICGYDDLLPKNDEYLCHTCKEYIDTNSDVITTCQYCPKCYDFGVGVDYDKNELLGWSWSEGSNGVGWIQYHASRSEIVRPWLQTELGGIYGIETIGSAFTYSPPSTQFSATYEIHAGGSIQHFKTKAGVQWTEESFENLKFPDIGEAYANVLGRIDFTGIDAGQYGPVESFSALQTSFILGGKIYKKVGSHTISATTTFNPGDSTTPDGSGLIIVEGDLNINANIRYNQAAIAKLKYLPSVAWIVKGDLNIDPSVTEIAGAFIVLGDGLPSDCPDNLTDASNGCGRFSTGAAELQLDVYGLVMAKQFNLQRSYYRRERGAELVIYDGRAIANTPPGLADITQVLPVWREIAP